MIRAIITIDPTIHLMAKSDVDSNQFANLTIVGDCDSEG